MSSNRKIVLLNENESVDKEFPFIEDEMVIGRSVAAHIQLNDPLISRKHVTIQVDGDEVWIQDNGSSHGTLLNDKPLKGMVSLSAGDMIQIAQFKLRFEDEPAFKDEDSHLILTQDEEMTMAEPQMDDEEFDERKTSFMGEEDLRGTGFFQAGSAVIDEEDEQDDGNETSALQQQSTRMLDAAELRGLKAGVQQPTDKSKNAFWGVLFLTMILGGLAYISTLYMGKEKEEVPMKTFENHRYEFMIVFPGHWMIQRSEADALLSCVYNGGGKEPIAHMNIHVNQDKEYSITGLTTGFDDYVDELKSRHQKADLLKNVILEVNNVKVMFYAFLTPQYQGKGIYVLNDELRIIVECYGSRLSYNSVASEFSEILQTFKLKVEQKYIDFPKPEITTVKLAEKNPALIKGEAQFHYDNGKQLLDRRLVQLGNLYHAMQEFKTCLQKASALATIPEVYRKAAEDLKYAKDIFDEAVKNQRYEMNYALHHNDYVSAYWEANKLMQMVPDKRDSIYQEARRWIRSLRFALPSE